MVAIQEPLEPTPVGVEGEFWSTQKLIWTKDIGGYVKQKAKLAENCPKAYKLIYGKCNKYTRSKLESHPNCYNIKLNYDVFLLIKSIKGLTYKLYGNNQKCQALHDAKKYFYKFYQSRESINAQYLETFKNKVAAVGQYGGSVRANPGLAKEELVAADPENPTAAETSRAFTLARARCLEIFLMCGSDLS